MRKILLFLFIFLVSCVNVYGFEDIFVDERPPQTEQLVSPQVQDIPEIVFDWADLSKEQRIENANKYKDIIFGDDSSIYLTKSDFKSTFAQYKKDKEYNHIVIKTFTY